MKLKSIKHILFRNKIDQVLLNPDKYQKCDIQKVESDRENYLNTILVSYNPDTSHWERGYIVNYDEEDGYTVLYSTHNICQYKKILLDLLILMIYIVFFINLKQKIIMIMMYIIIIQPLFPLPEPSRGISIYSINCCYYFISKYLEDLIKYITNKKNV